MTKFKFKSVMIFIAILTITCLTYSIKNADADALPVITDGVLGIELPDVKYIGGVLLMVLFMKVRQYRII